MLENLKVILVKEKSRAYYARGSFNDYILDRCMIIEFCF